LIVWSIKKDQVLEVVPKPESKVEKYVKIIYDMKAIYQFHTERPAFTARIIS